MKIILPKENNENKKMAKIIDREFKIITYGKNYFMNSDELKIYKLFYEFRRKLRKKMKKNNKTP